MLMSASTALAEKLTIKSVMSGEFAPQRVYGVNPLEGTDQYASISNDHKRVVRYSFKTGAETGVLFDADNTQGVKVESIDGYIMSDNINIVSLEVVDQGFMYSDHQPVRLEVVIGN